MPALTIARFAGGDLDVEIVYKDVRHLRLTVTPPAGAVRISVPRRMNLAVVRDFVSARQDWIRRHQQRIRERPYRPPPSRAERRRDREMVKLAVPALIAQWEPIVGRTVARFSVRHMKSRWGSCTPRTATIRLNSELAQKPPECLNYVVLHEMVHLLEPSHNARFHALMDGFMPGWRMHRTQLKR